MTHKLKNDRYRRARGGNSRLLDISCAQCGTHLMVYQKDGPGLLKRAYVDRILEPHGLKSLRCSKCQHVIGVPYVYPTERRPAFMIEIGSIQKKIMKNV